MFCQKQNAFIRFCSYLLLNNNYNSFLILITCSLVNKISISAKALDNIHTFAISVAKLSLLSFSSLFHFFFYRLGVMTNLTHIRNICMYAITDYMFIDISAPGLCLLKRLLSVSSSRLLINVSLSCCLLSFVTYSAIVVCLFLNWDILCVLLCGWLYILARLIGGALCCIKICLIPLYFAPVPSQGSLYFVWCF